MCFFRGASTRASWCLFFSRILAENNKPTFRIACGLQNTDLHMDVYPSLMPGTQEDMGNSEPSATLTVI
jgi:hypothetical protein